MNLYGPAEDTATISYLRKHRRRLWYTIKHAPVRDPWLDMGRGESVFRANIADYYRAAPYSCDVDLDTQLLPYTDGKFRTVTSFEVIEHLLNPLAAMREAWRVLQPGGRLYLTTPNDAALIYRAEHLISRKYRWHFHQFTAAELLTLLTRAGFTDVHVDKFFRSNTGTLARISRNGLFAEASK